jgi:hypothetical protein
MKNADVTKFPRNVDVFWAEMAACDHCVQIYEDDMAFLNALEGFVVSGLRQQEAIIIIATDSHVQSLTERLALAGVDLAAAVARDQFVAIEAQAALATFMQDGSPDETRFLAFVRALLKRARTHCQKVRAFGEMVALLWASGNRAATVRLEHLWARLCKSEEFALFCAYPRAGFTQNAEQSMMDVHLAHSVVFNAA